jgi:hypothetical protein
MSWGKCQVCITIGIAEPIAIKTIVTANIFAISLRLWPGWLGLLTDRRVLPAVTP